MAEANNNKNSDRGNPDYNNPVRIYMESGELEKNLLTVEHKLFMKNVGLFRQGHRQKMIFGAPGAAVIVEIPEEVVDSMLEHLLDMRPQESVLRIMKRLEERMG